MMIDFDSEAISKDIEEVSKQVEINKQNQKQYKSKLNDTQYMNSTKDTITLNQSRMAGAPAGDHNQSMLSNTNGYVASHHQ